MKTRIIGISKITKDKFPLRFTKKKQKEFSFEFASVLHYSLITRSFMLVLMLISMPMSTDSVDFLFCLLFYLVIMLMLLVRTRL